MNVESEELLDNMARELYQQRSKSPRPMTDDRWANIKAKFPSSVQVCREEILAMEDEGE